MPSIAGKEVGAIGFGLMGFHINHTPYEEAFKTMKAALAAGATFWNGGEFYGSAEDNSLHLLHAYFIKYPEDAERVFLSIKGGDHANGKFEFDGSKQNIQRSIDECLRILDGVKKIDLFQCARVDPIVPIEDTINYVADYVKAGKIGSIGISEVGAASIRKAASVHPIAAVEIEYSLFTSDIETNDVAATCAELNIPIIAYSPLGRGWLTGQIKSAADIEPMRKTLPRFNDENFPKNLELAKKIYAFAEQKGCTPAQLAIGWVKAHSNAQGFPTVIPLPGATKVSRVEENMKEVAPSTAELAEIQKILASMEVAGARYPPFLEKLSFA